MYAGYPGPTLDQATAALALWIASRSRVPSFTGSQAVFQSQRTSHQPVACRIRSSRCFSARMTSVASRPAGRRSSYLIRPSTSPASLRSGHAKSRRATNSPFRSNTSCWRTGLGIPARAMWTRLIDSAGDSLLPSAKARTLRARVVPRNVGCRSSGISRSAGSSPCCRAASAAATAHSNGAVRARSQTVRAGVVTGMCPVNVTSASVIAVCRARSFPDWQPWPGVRRIVVTCPRSGRLTGSP